MVTVTVENEEKENDKYDLRLEFPPVILFSSEYSSSKLLEGL